MRIVALEEHVMLPEMTQRIPASIAVEAGWVPSGGDWGPGPLNEALGDIQNGRIDAMIQAGVTLQVLSVIGPGAELLAGEEGISFARDYNDRLAAAVERHPDHFAAFAHLPMKEPAAAADELERCVEKLGFRGASINGTTDGLFLDDPRFAPILSRAEALACPLYIHPGPPPRAVRDVYYGGLPSEISSYLLSNAGFGWHSEVAIQILRLVLSGALDRNPGLKLIIGHMGELLPMLLKRVDETFGTVAETGRQRTVSETILDQVWITTSGFFDTSAFLAALTAFGTDRILFSIDYPYATNGAGVAFLNNLPVSKADRARIAHGNADSLLGL
ncbi:MULTISPECIES: amidohydrolase family protein [Agrobacterium]|uniref:amidohydrolase family protein n=1 Tax=Agrobacterium TaxID=357 RepID=UPI00156AF015|nr:MULTISPECIES: amidohydrolase family protein [Agrobacterium]QKJ94683.1 amidohydrolase [Agrobacterium pusense]WCK69074.1 amidohydrolase family protein [Agrobacterium tumefaciens]